MLIENDFACIILLIFLILRYVMTVEMSIHCYALFDICRCDIFVCFNVYGTLVVVQCSSFLLCCMLYRTVECVRGILVTLI